MIHLRWAFRILAILPVLGAFLGAQAPTWAAEVPKELQVPQAWIEGAKREGKLVILGTETPQEMSGMIRAFNQRYPFITVEYTKAPTMVRDEKALLAAKQGKPIADLVTAIGGRTAAFVDAGVLMDTSNLPVWNSYPKEHKLLGKYLGGPFVRYWSLAYNTNLVPKNEVPTSWEDLLQPKWKGKVAANSISRLVTFVPLWYAWGGEKSTRFLQALLDNGLQVRKEGHDASIKLLEAGEYSLLITAGEYQVYQDQQKGAPADWVALDPVPVTPAAPMAVMKDAPHPYAVRIYVNWLLSEEGQRVYAAETGTFPVHPKLANLSPNFKDWAKRMAGKRKALRTMETDYESSKPGSSPADTVWNRLVLKGL